MSATTAAIPAMWRDWVVLLYSESKYIQIDVRGTTVHVEWGGVTLPSWRDKPILHMDQSTQASCVSFDHACQVAHDTYIEQKGHQGKVYWPARCYTPQKQNTPEESHESSWS